MNGIGGSLLEKNHTLKFTGEEQIEIQSIFNNISNNFTYEFWVKPEDTHRLVPETNLGIFGSFDQRYVIVPGYSIETDNAGVGVSVGTNGISVFEHTSEHLPAVLVYQTKITNWTHVAIVYEDKTPKLYINGELIKQGLKSQKQNVFSSGVFGADDLYGQYKGMISDLRIWDHVRTSQQIKENMNKNLSGFDAGLFGYWKFENNSRYINDYSVQCNHGILRDNIGNHFIKLLKDSKISVNLNNHYVVDIIIPIYNAFEYVQRCIESIYRNTNQSYNLFLINDCSNDDRVFSFLEQLRYESKPPQLKQLIIIHNQENEGFVKSVNKGLLLSENHVILLNSDTEVPPNWSIRLLSPILLTNNIASVTPFSNSATICSFPNIFENNPLPFGMNVDEVDRLFEKYSSNEPIEIPTGVGFCMAMSRNVLKRIGYLDEETFGKGYGEENDWCRRAIKVGFKNVLIPTLFVYHKDGMSFNEDPLNRKQLSLNNGNILGNLYPDYYPSVRNFVDKDSIGHIRDLLKSIMYAKDKKGILFIIHSWGGGTEYTQNLRIKNIINETRCLRFRLDYTTNKLFIEDLNLGSTFCMSLNDLNQQTFNNLLEILNIESIWVDQLVTYPIYYIMDLIKNSETNYVYNIHDFYCVCPRINLLDSHDKYCNAETDVSKCQKCIDVIYPEIDIKYWRTQFQSFLKNAKKIIAPSENTRQLILKYYPNLNITVENHKKVDAVRHTFDTAFALDTDINIAVIGSITKLKGSDIIFDLLEQIRIENLPINIKIIGKIYGEYAYETQYLSEDRKFEVTGPYNNEEISTLLEKHRISLVIISTLCPETYCWTASEAMWSGYPIITFNIGAPADRVKQLDGGWIAEEMGSKSILKLLKQLLIQREEILAKADNLKKAFWDKMEK